MAHCVNFNSVPGPSSGSCWGWLQRLHYPSLRSSFFFFTTSSMLKLNKQQQVRYFSWLGVRLWKSWQRWMQRKKVSWDKREWFLKICLCSPEIKWVENEGLVTCPTLGRGSTSSLEACQVFLDSNTSCLNTVARNLVTKKRDAMSSSGKLRTSTVLDYGLSSPNRFQS